jgi:hypothetical protein
MENQRHAGEKGTSLIQTYRDVNQGFEYLNDRFTLLGSSIEKKRQSDRLISTLAEYHHQQYSVSCAVCQCFFLPDPAKSVTIVPVTLPASIEGQRGDCYLYTFKYVGSTPKPGLHRRYY